MSDEFPHAPYWNGYSNPGTFFRIVFPVGRKKASPPRGDKRLKALPTEGRKSGVAFVGGGFSRDAFLDGRVPASRLKSLPRALSEQGVSRAH